MSQQFRIHKLRWIWLAIGWVGVMSVFYLSLAPHPPGLMHFWNADKLEHALAYSLLMLWFCQVYRQGRSRLFLAFLLVVMGVAIEYLQGETDYRTFDYADMFANCVGVLVGWAWARTGLGRVFAYLEFHLVKKSNHP